MQVFLRVPAPPGTLVGVPVGRGEEQYQTPPDAVIQQHQAGFSTQWAVCAR
ncbi:MAG: hypothetical protein HC828_01495 [Blastochloris sp.]|nr:hypothetical protein [Blastochloris sp.]